MSTWNDQPGVIEFPDGRRVRGTGVRKARGDIPTPDFAVYLLGREPAECGWPHRWVRWPDFRLPSSTRLAVATLREAYDRAPAERVEIACGGGVGRTGTAMALLATFGGVAPEHAVDWVRGHYHRRAVETRRQRRWVQETARGGGSVNRRRPESGL